MKKSKIRKYLEMIVFPKENMNEIKEVMDEYGDNYVKLNEEHLYYMNHEATPHGLRRIADSLLGKMYKTHKSPFKKTNE